MHTVLKTSALLKLAELRIKDPKNEGLQCIVDYLNYIEKELAKFSTTHMSEVWKDYERLKESCQDFINYLYKKYPNEQIYCPYIKKIEDLLIKKEDEI